MKSWVEIIKQIFPIVLFTFSLILAIRIHMDLEGIDFYILSILIILFIMNVFIFARIQDVWGLLEPGIQEIKKILEDIKKILEKILRKESDTDNKSNCFEERKNKNGEQKR